MEGGPGPSASSLCPRPRPASKHVTSAEKPGGPHTCAKPGLHRHWGSERPALPRSSLNGSPQTDRPGQPSSSRGGLVWPCWRGARATHGRRAVTWGQRPSPGTTRDSWRHRRGPRTPAPQGSKGLQARWEGQHPHQAGAEHVGSAWPSPWGPFSKGHPRTSESSEGPSPCKARAVHPQPGATELGEQSQQRRHGAWGGSPG